ncbi:hypothetical protein [Methylosarcina fibrata]|jgi:hypothetical protein|uniref:hypothetical protein n=1 Tax=Methylosarcina fibrata TaxID=105972 RepID=UPI0003600E8D|nr:hypothetical protein [Methylosarcina fibrata]
MNTEIDERGRRFFNEVRNFKQNNPNASWLDIDRFIEKKLEDIFGDTLPPDQKDSFAAFGRAWR